MNYKVHQLESVLLHTNPNISNYYQKQQLNITYILICKPREIYETSTHTIYR